MRKIILSLVMCVSFISYAQEKISVPPHLKLNFEKEFKGAKDVSWSMFYRGKYRDQLRFEVEFLQGNSKYLVSYDKEDKIKAIEKSIAISSLKVPILEYLKRKYPTFEVNEASKITKDNGTEFYNVGIADSDNFFVLVFNDVGDFLYLTSLGERY
ncbi:hypothetical protein FIA58_001660 [Flavobacterium jejuense]|uniref:Beta-lactamase-inhibitor-like PepSY-like domain-containing protein n=1 Tax=Flavobacterium jejuense TaxID=1544455 RepID=A0ABX0IKX2_9FLAO|nr:hypothetical protein [Flavobacterium jejuense]NHN24368.1 hypothetical protein [Flavobacterium jejuense]